MNDRRHEERIEAEAADWLAALDCGRADPVAFEAWRAADPAHAIAFIRINATWRQLDRLALSSEPAPETVEEPEARPSSPQRRRILQAAGLGTVVATAGAVFAVQRAAAHVVETDIGERQRFFINEKVCFDLNTASRLRWWRSGDGIEVELEHGQMRADLARGAPTCTVHAGPATLRLGSGAFDMRLLSPAEADIVAISGEAQLVARRGATGAVRLRKQQGLSVSDQGASSLPRAVSDDAMRARSAWRDGELIFEGQTLGEAVAEYNRYLRTPLAVDGDAARLRLGGRFLTSDPSEFLEAARLNFGLRTERRGGEILLRR